MDQRIFLSEPPRRSAREEIIHRERRSIVSPPRVPYPCSETSYLSRVKHSSGLIDRIESNLLRRFTPTALVAIYRLLVSPPFKLYQCLGFDPAKPNVG